MRRLQVSSAVAVLLLVLVSAYPNGSGSTEQESGRQEDDPQTTLLNNLAVGKAAADGNGSFDPFRQSLEQQREIKVTVEQLRQVCKEFAQNNPPERQGNGWFNTTALCSH
uniref:Uncharacterized protein n=1 Tax=Plectus sambesii TaxID=2011161 RepID=A0A914VW93_9BILA